MTNSKFHNECLFCRKHAKLTKEHVIPNWLSKVASFGYLRVTNEITGDIPLSWDSGAFQHKAKIVCADCNNGWMCSLEGEVQPILTDLIEFNQRILSAQDQAVLSFWVQKTMLMINESIPNNLKITQDIYSDIYKNQSATKKFLVNIGWRMKYKGISGEPIASYTIQQILSVDVPCDILQEVNRQKMAGGMVWKMVFAIGPVVFEMAGHNMNVTLEINTNSRVFTPIRPYMRNIKWPLEWPIEAEGGLVDIQSR